MTPQAAQLIDNDVLVAGDRAKRRHVAFPACGMREDGSVVGMTVVDLSYDGCRVTCAEVLEPGERLKLSVLRRGAMPVTVRRVNGDKAGLSFDPETVAAPVRQPRSYQRVSVEGEISMRRSGKLNFQVQVYDLSLVGCKAEFVERPVLDEQLWIKFEGLEALEASVRWIAGPKAGVEFTRAIHPAVFDLLLSRLGARA
jgi:hypothetical protein